MLTDKIFKILQDNLYIDHSYTPGYSTIENREDCAQLIVELLTPKLQWKHLYENVWIGKTPFDYTFTLHLEDDGLWKIHKLKFQGTVEGCKKECERLFMEMYLTTCE